MHITDEQRGALKVAYEKVALWPENRMKPDAVLELGQGFTDLLELRNIVGQILAALAPVEPVAVSMDDAWDIATESLDDSMDMDWTTRRGARAVVNALKDAGFLTSPPSTPSPVPPSGAKDPEHEFRNFHLLLCERFNYCHDPKDWKRDQISLIEHIARLVPPSTPSEDDLVAALSELLETLKINKRSVLHSMTRRETDELMASMHKGNTALIAIRNERAGGGK